MSSVSHSSFLLCVLFKKVTLSVYSWNVAALTPPLAPTQALLPRGSGGGRSPEFSDLDDNVYQVCCEAVTEESLGKVSASLLSLILLIGIQNEATSSVSRHRLQDTRPSPSPKPWLV